MLTVSLLPPSLTEPQAKTTKKIVLRMQCTECKQTCMKGLKVRMGNQEAGRGKGTDADMQSVVGVVIAAAHR